MTSLNPAHFELHLVFSTHRDVVAAFSLRPAASDLPSLFCQYLADNLDNPLRACVFAYNDALIFRAAGLDAKLRVSLPTSYYLDVFRFLSTDIFPRPLGCCRDPLQCMPGPGVYVYDQTKSPANRLVIPCRSDSA